MHFDPTITAGTLISVCVSIVTVAVGVLRVNSKISKMEMKLNMMWAQYKKDHGINYSKSED